MNQPSRSPDRTQSPRRTRSFHGHFVRELRALCVRSTTVVLRVHRVRRCVSRRGTQSPQRTQSFYPDLLCGLRVLGVRLFFVAVCGLCAWGSLPALHAQPRDLRLVEAVKRRDQKMFAALLRAKADLNAAQPDGATALAW